MIVIEEGDEETWWMPQINFGPSMVRGIGILTSERRIKTISYSDNSLGIDICVLEVANLLGDAGYVGVSGYDDKSSPNRRLLDDLVCNRRYNAEVVSSSFKTEEEISVGGVSGSHHLAGGKCDLELNHSIAREPDLVRGPRIASS